VTTLINRRSNVKFQYLLMRAAHHGVAHVLGIILFLGGAGIGLSLIFAPNSYFNYQSLHQNFEFASPIAWGTAFLVASIALVVTLFVQPNYAQLPALILGAVFIIFGILTLFSAVTPAVWAFIALGWISIFTQVICWAEEKREGTLHHYEPN